MPVLTRSPGADRPCSGRSAPGIHIRLQKGPLQEGIQGREPTPPGRHPPQRTSRRGILIAPDPGIRHWRFPPSGRCLPAPSDSSAHSLSVTGSTREPREIVIQGTGAQGGSRALVTGHRFGRVRLPDLTQIVALCMLRSVPRKPLQSERRSTNECVRSQFLQDHRAPRVCASSRICSPPFFAGNSPVESQRPLCGSGFQRGRRFRASSESTCSLHVLTSRNRPRG